MKTFIQIVLSLLLLTILMEANAQQYYYSRNKKIFLNEDTTTFYINTQKQNNEQKFLSSLLKVDGVRIVAKTKYDNTFSVKITGSINKNKMQNNLETDTSIFHVSTAFDLDGLPFIPTGEILLKINENLTLDQLIEELQLKAQVTIVNGNNYDISVLKADNIDSVFQIANSIYESKLVKWCHPNFFVPITTFTNDPLWPQQYYLNNTGQIGGVVGIDINVVGAWNLSRGANIRVAVIDEGVEDHEDLGGRVLNGFTPRDVNGNGRPIITGAHGEATAGIIAATQDNNIGITGIAPQSQIVPVNIFAGGETALDIANGINWAWNQGQADVLSNSWGYNTTSQTQPNFDAIIQAITNARTQGRNGKGAIVVFASGNNFGNGINDVSFPANVNGVITVGSCNNAAPAGAIWYYSQRGASMDLVAPSGDINLNGDLTTLDRMGNLGYEAGNYTNRFGGTSAACPQVSGVAALMLSINPNLTEAQATNILQTTASDMGTAGFDNTFGYGRVNACAATRQVFATTTISGNNTLCSNTGQYFTGNALPNSVTWTSSNTNIATVQATGNPVTVTRVSNGNVTITATLNACGNPPLILTKTITIGIPTAPSITAANWDRTCGSNLDAVCSHPLGATGYKWVYNGAIIQDGTSDTYSITPMRTNTQIGQTYTNSLVVQARNTCGLSASSVTKYYTFGPVTASCNNGGGQLTVSPNPASNSLTVSTVDKRKFSSLKIVDHMGITRKIINPKAVERSVINISDLQNGIYHVQALISGQWASTTFIKE